MAEFVVEKDRKQNTEGIWLVLAAVSAVLLSVFAAYESVFPTGIEPGMIGGIFIMVVFILGLLVWKKEHLGRKILLLMVFMGIAAFWGRKRLAGGIAPFVNHYIEQRNLFYHVEQPGMEAVTDPVGEAAVLAGILLLLGTVLAVVLRTRRGGVLALAVMMIPVALAATVGHMPSFAAAWGMMAAGGLYLILYHRMDGVIPLREIVMAATVLAALYLCTAAALPQIQKYKEVYRQEYTQIQDAIITSQAERLDIRQMIEDRLSYNSNYAAGGIGEGDFQDLSENRPQGTEELAIMVTEQPESSIYLRAYAGTDYTGNGWEELEASRFGERLSYDAGREVMDEPFRRIENGSNSVKKQKMRIQILEAKTGYGYAPYYAEVPADGAVSLDACIEGSGKGDREYTYYPREQAENLSSGELGMASELWESYKGFVQETYLEYPGNLTSLDEWCASIEDSSIETVADEIDQRFAADLSYTLTPGQSPADRDFAEYFLFENQQGFCVHFATAAVLIYRECGYPARYVEGYMVLPDEFERQEDGTYKAVVTDEMAHAWCETFDSETGWQVREHTLPYREDGYSAMPAIRGQGQDGQDIEDDLSAMEDEETNIPAESDLSENDEAAEADTVSDGENDGENADDHEDGAGNAENSDRKGNGTSDVIRRIGSVAVTGLLVFGILSAFCIVQQKIRRRKKMRRFRVRKGNDGIAAIYNEIYEICVFMGLEHPPEEGRDKAEGQELQTERRILERMKAGFPQLADEEWEWLYDCAERAAFAPEKIGKEERKQCYLLYRKFRKKIIKGLAGWRKLWFLYGKGM